jgi:F-type H+-transporting ATPase subunit epsilon
MKIKILLPAYVFLEQEVQKIVAEGRNGYFCLLPRHIDFVSALMPGILMLEDKADLVEYFAVSEGILVKIGPQVYISVHDAVKGESLTALKATVEEKFMTVSKREEASRNALGKLEADTIRRFMELGGETRGG